MVGCPALAACAEVRKPPRRTGSGERLAVVSGWRVCGIGMARGGAGIQSGRCRTPSTSEAGRGGHGGRRPARGCRHSASAPAAGACAAASVDGGRVLRDRARAASGPAYGLHRGTVCGQCGRGATEACGACLQPVDPDGCVRAAPAATWRVWWCWVCVCGRTGLGARGMAQRAIQFINNKRSTPTKRKITSLLENRHK